MFRFLGIRDFERGLVFRDKAFRRVLKPGRHVLFDPLFDVRVERASVRDPFIRTADLDLVVKSGALGSEAVVIDLADDQRALVWVDGRFQAALRPGLYALFTVFRKVRVEVMSTRDSFRLEAKDLPAILENRAAKEMLDVVSVDAAQAGLLFRDGAYAATLEAGTYAFWKGTGRTKVQIVDQREQVVDVQGQDIMTADKVTLRLNATVVYRVADPLLAVMKVDDFRQALYREAQLALRASVGTKELDALLVEKDQVAKELTESVRRTASVFGLAVTALGIRDVILPGDMKDLLNKVTEAKKAAEAALITRREETAAMRSQSNTARILEGNPTLMRLRELEVLERVAANGKLQVVLGDKGLADRIVNLI